MQQSGDDQYPGQDFGFDVGGLDDRSDDAGEQGDEERDVAGEVGEDQRGYAPAQAGLFLLGEVGSGGQYPVGGQAVVQPKPGIDRNQLGQGVPDGKDRFTGVFPALPPGQVAPVEIIESGGEQGEQNDSSGGDAPGPVFQRAGQRGAAVVAESLFLGAGDNFAAVGAVLGRG